jgi:tetratricopeptide (TPR) repeat protein
MVLTQSPPLSVSAGAENPEAAAAGGAALAIAEKFANLNQDAEWQRDFGNCHKRISSLLAAGNPVSARSAYTETLDLAEKLAAVNPEDAEWQRDLWINAEKIGDGLTAVRDHENALTAYRLGLMIAEKLAALDPVNAVRRRNVLASRAKVDAALAAAGGRPARQDPVLFSERSDLFSSTSSYTEETPSPEAAVPPQLRMGETETIQAAAELLSRVYPEKAVRKALENLAAEAARTAIGRAKAKPRAGKSSHQPDLTAIRLAAAFEALKRSSDLENPKLSATERQRRAKHLVRTYERLREHDPALEDDSGVVGRARSIVNDANYQRRKKAQKAVRAATMG